MSKIIRRPSKVLKEQAGDLLARLRLGVVDEVVITRYGKPEAVLVRYQERAEQNPK